MNDNNNKDSGGVGVVGLMGVVFVVLKLVGVIDRSWWWVTAPFWGSLAIAIAITLIYVIVKLIIKIFKRNPAKNRSQVHEN